MRDRGVQPIRLATWALAALAAACSTAAPALAQTKELRFGHLHSVESPIHKGVTKAAEEFAKTSGGRYKINVFPSSQLGAAREMVAQVIDGTLDFISEGPGSLSNLNKALSLFEAPFVARDWDHVHEDAGLAVRPGAARQARPASGTWSTSGPSTTASATSRPRPRRSRPRPT